MCPKHLKLECHKQLQKLHIIPIWIYIKLQPWTDDFPCGPHNEIKKKKERERERVSERERERERQRER